VGVEVKSVFVWLLGGLTHLAYKPDKPTHNLFIAAAGPLVNMLLAFLCVAVYVGLSFFSLRYSANVQLFVWFQTLMGLSLSLASINLLLIVFNLLPIFPLDGGNIMHALMEIFFGKSNADWITLIVSLPFLALLVAFGIYAHDYVLLAFCLLIALAVSTLNRSLLRRVNLSVNYVFRRSGYYFLQGDYERAAKAYTDEIEKGRAGYAPYLARAGSYLFLGQTMRAAADIDRVLKLEPNHAMALYLRGELYAMDKNYDAAMDIYSRSQKENPHWPIPYFDMGSVQLERGELQAALENLNQAISLQSRMPLFYLVRSLAYFKLGDLDSAHQDQDLAVRLSRGETLVVADVNQSLFENNFAWAQDFYTRVLTQNPRDGFALHGYADACRVNNEHSLAVDLYTRALSVNPREVRLYLGRGRSYLKLNQPEKARTDFEKIIPVTNKLHLQHQAEELLRTLQGEI